MSLINVDDKELKLLREKAKVADALWRRMCVADVFTDDSAVARFELDYGWVIMTYDDRSQTQTWNPLRIY